VFHKLGLRYISNKLDAFVNNRFGHTSDHISLRQMWEFIYFNNVGHHVFVLDRHLMSQPGYSWTVGSGRRDEDLNMKVLFH